MTKIKINNTEFVSDNLSLAGKIALASIQLIDTKIEKIKFEILVVEMAHNQSIDFIKTEIEANSGL